MNPYFLISIYLCTGCSLNIVFFFEDFEIFRTLFSLGVSVCTHTRQVEHQRSSRTGRVQKNSDILRKNTIINEHPVAMDRVMTVCSPNACAPIAPLSIWLLLFIFILIIYLHFQLFICFSNIKKSY